MKDIIRELDHMEEKDNDLKKKSGEGNPERDI